MKKAKARPKKNKKGSVEDDGALWTAVTESVEPLAGRDKPLSDFDAVPPPPRRQKLQPVEHAPIIRKTPLPDLHHGSQPGLDKSTAKRLRRGKVQLGGKLDLHGMTQDEARPALEDFIERAWAAGKREVLVVTGKGTRADGSIGVLRQAVPGWLNLPVNRLRITAFVHAAPKDGGEGALYVRLKKRS